METTMQQVGFNNETSNKGANLEGASIAKPLKEFTKEPDAGYRLSRQIAKKDKTGKYEGLQASLGVIVPANLSVQEAAQRAGLQEYLQNSLFELQDKLIRTLVEQSTTVQHSEISLAKMEEFAATLQGVGKLSEEKIDAWFKSDVADVVAAVFSLQVGKEPQEFTQEQLKQLAQRQNAVKSLLLSLQSSKASLASEAIKTKLREYIDGCDESLMKNRMLQRLEKVEIVSDDNL